MENKQFEEIEVNSNKELENIEVIDLSKDVNDILSSVKEAIKILIHNLLESLKNISISKDTINDIVRSFCESVDRILKEADLRIHQIENDENVLLAWEKVKDTYLYVTERVVVLVHKAFSYCMKNDTFKDSYEYVEKTGHEIKETINEKYQEFIHDPSVRKVVVASVDSAKDFKDKLIKGIKDYLSED